MSTKDIQTRAKLDMMADSKDYKGLSQPEFMICCLSLSEIISRGSTKQSNEKVLNFFKENGYKVSKVDNSNYIIERN